MGLSAPKSRTKLSNDPNNTTWSSNTSAYGHRLLTSQGWAPGTTLGATNAPQAAHYTAANSSHIRVLLREDNAGLGAKRGGESKETFGLKGLEGIFGRLNGRDEGKEIDVEKEGKQRDAMLRVRYGGVMGFVSGGFLVGDRLVVHKAEAKEGGRSKRKADGGEEEGRSNKRAKATREESRSAGKVSKKALTDADVIRAAKKARKASRQDEINGDLEVEMDVQMTATDADAQAAKAARKAKRRSKTSADDPDENARRAAKKEKKRLKRLTAKDEPNDPSETLTAGSKTRKDSNLEKAARKDARRARRDAKAKLQVLAEPSEDTEATSVLVVTPVDSAPATPAPSQPQSLFGGSRHAVRQRYIAQKRMASMDGRAMQEILMLKAGA